MDIGTLLLVALGLSMDAFAVSISNGMCFKNYGGRQVVLAAGSFGFFQGMMPVLGFLAGQLFAASIEALDHWIALVMLGWIGGKMALEGARQLHQPEACAVGQQFELRLLMMQSVATSIDALAVGVGFAVMKVHLPIAASLIAGTTFACCLAGGVLGRRFGDLLGRWAQLLGGLVLVFIGLKIFIEHTLG